MKIKKKSALQFPKVQAHQGEVSRRLYLDKGELENPAFQALTRGFILAGGKISWHMHEDMEEVMLVLIGTGIVRERDGEYSYAEGDLFIFPKGVEHEIENTSKIENEYIFIRIKND